MELSEAVGIACECIDYVKVRYTADDMVAKLVAAKLALRDLAPQPQSPGSNGSAPVPSPAEEPA